MTTVGVLASGASVLPKWFENDKQTQNRRSRQQEKKLAKGSGGRVQAGSGSSWRAPQDIKTDEHLVQVKYTDKDSYPLKVLDLIQIATDAYRCGKTPVLIVDFPARRKRAVIHIQEIP